MSTSIDNLRRLAERDVKDHTALFDLYVTMGRDIDYLAIKFGIDPDDLINLLEGYGEKLRITAEDVSARPELATVIMEDKETAAAIEEFGVAIDYSGKGRYKKLSRLLIEEYVGHFYPGIASENPENDWICLEAYLDVKHPAWRSQIGAAGISRAGAAERSRPGKAGADSTEEQPDAGNEVRGIVRPKKMSRRKTRNTFRLY